MIRRSTAYNILVLSAIQLIHLFLPTALYHFSQKMFLSLLEKAFELKYSTMKDPDRKVSSIIPISIKITVYEAKQGIYPQSEEEWNSYDGIILPGSMSSAYQDDEWIRKLKHIIQSEIHGKGRKTLAICFGHQLFAHSFQGIGSKNSDDDDDGVGGGGGGIAAPCPQGLQVGRRRFSIDNNLINVQAEQSSISLDCLYTHEDMVVSLPKCAVCLGGTETVPIQAAAYFTDVGGEGGSETLHQGNIRPQLRRPYAFTFQGHPEYATDLGLQTFKNIIKKFEENDRLNGGSLAEAQNDALESIYNVEDNCVKLMKAIGDVFGWIDFEATPK